MRIAALWFPDWPVQAARLGDAAAIVVGRHQVVACDGRARRAGVRRGMRLRQAQAVCPEAQVVEHNPERDGVAFSALADSLDAVASSVEAIRPGMAVVDAGAAGRFHGGEDKALEMLLDATALAGVDMALGVADELATALIAARQPGGGAVVGPGASAEFLAAQPVSVLAAEVALGCPAEFVRHCERLGLRTLGDVAALPRGQVGTRFGAPGLRAHRIATATPDRRVAPPIPGLDLAVTLVPEEPLTRVDAAAFAARELAAKLHRKLTGAGLVCTRLKVTAALAGDMRVERTWRTRAALSERATADRVRWQLDGWLTRNQADNSGGIVELTLEPVDVARPETENLWGSQASSEHARRAVARVQSQLGTDKVLVPRVAGGRGVAERIELIPYGERQDPVAPGSWPGRIPAPLPARLGGGVDHPASKVCMLTRAGQPVIVTAEALLSGTPYAVKWGNHTYHVAGWAGPWPVDERWWEADAGDKVARLQLVGQAPQDKAQRAWLLQWVQGSWRVEAAYF